MNKQLIQRILDDLAEEAIPSEGKPWEVFLSRLTMEERIKATGQDVSFPSKPLKKPRWVGATVTFIFLIVLVAIFSLPQGRAWAQEILQYFIRESDQVTLPMPLPVNLVAVTPGVIQPTLTPANPPGQGMPFYDICGGISEPTCSGEQIRKMVEFPVKGISDLPEGMVFIGATGGPESVILIYRFGDPTGDVLLLQEAPATEAAEQAIPVGSSAVIEEVPINDSIGEYVKGSYFHYAGDLIASWKPDSGLQSLRWKEGDMLYSISMAGMNAETLDKNSLVKLAVSLNADVDLPTYQSITEITESVVEAEKKAGFQVIEPVWLPNDLQFERATYLPDRDAICLEYINSNNKNMDETISTSVSIIESQLSLPPDLSDLIFANLRPDQVLLEKTNLEVGGAKDGKGLYAYGSIDASRICGSRLQNQILQIRMADRNITILAKSIGPSADDSRDWLTRQELVRVAEGITGVHTITEDQTDPEYLTSPDAIQQMAEFPLKTVTKLPEGMKFFICSI